MNFSINNFTLWLKQNIFRLIFFVMTFLIASYYSIQFSDSLFYTVNLNIAQLIYFILFIIVSFTPPILTFIRMISKNQELYPEYSGFEIAGKLFLVLFLFMIYFLFITFCAAALAVALD